MDPVSLDLALLFPFKRNKASLLIMNWWKKIMIYSIAFHFSDELKTFGDLFLIYLEKKYGLDHVQIKSVTPLYLALSEK